MKSLAIKRNKYSKHSALRGLAKGDVIYRRKEMSTIYFKNCTNVLELLRLDVPSTSE